MRVLPLALDIFPPQTEAAFQASVVQLARLCGYRVQWWWTSKNSPSGFPDLFMVRGTRAIAAELKRRGGMRPRPSQQAWLDDLALVPGIESYAWTPEDWPRIVAILQGGIPNGATRGGSDASPDNDRRTTYRRRPAARRATVVRPRVRRTKAATR